MYPISPCLPLLHLCRVFSYTHWTLTPTPIPLTPYLYPRPYFVWVFDHWLLKELLPLVIVFVFFGSCVTFTFLFIQILYFIKSWSLHLLFIGFCHFCPDTKKSKVLSGAVLTPTLARVCLGSCLAGTVTPWETSHVSADFAAPLQWLHQITLKWVKQK